MEHLLFGFLVSSWNKPVILLSGLEIQLLDKIFRILYSSHPPGYSIKRCLSPKVLVVITVEPTGKFSFVYTCIQTRLMGLSLVCVLKPQVTEITAISTL